MLSSFRQATSNCEDETKFLQDRIGSVEKNFAELCSVFSQYSRKAARIRDKGDEIAIVSINYAESESINKSLSECISNFSSSMTTLSDYGDVRVKAIDNKVVNEFGQYEGICKHVKDEIKHILNVRDKELNRKRQLDKIRDRNPRNRHQIVQAETELIKATTEVTRTIHNLEEQTTAFERQKLHDIKAILLDFISIEMGYHARGLETLTKAYRSIDSIDEDSDLQDFKKSLQINDGISRVSPQGTLTKAVQSLGSLSTLFSSPQKKRSPGIPKSIQKSSKRVVSKSEETLDSIKHDLSELSSDDTMSSSESEDGTNTSSTKKSQGRQSPVSPFTAKKFLK